MSMHTLWLVPLGGLFMVAVVVVVIVLLVHFLSGPGRAAPPYPPGPPGAPPHPPGPPGAPPMRETPLDILARRFASGEINAEEYERSRNLLRDEPPG